MLDTKIFLDSFLDFILIVQIYLRNTFLRFNVLGTLVCFVADRTSKEKNRRPKWGG